MPPRVMLVLPTQTYRATAFLRAADRLGIEAVVASNQAPTLAGLMEGRVLTLDLGRPDQAALRAVEFCRRWPVDAVVGVDEGSVLAAAHVAAALGLAHDPTSAVAATRDKRLLRARLAAAGVAQPRFTEITADPAGTAAAGAADAVGLPAVVKPVDLAGSRGVIRADSVAELAAAIARVDALLREGGLCAVGDQAPLLVEAFVPGPELAVEALVDAGQLHPVAIFDKPDPLEGPFFEESLYITPSRHPAAVIDAVLASVAAGVAALGLRRGPIHAELRIGPDGPVVIEIAARSIGGLCSRALRLVGGEGVERSLEELILAQAIGGPVSASRLLDPASGVLMLPIADPGVLVRVDGVAAVRALPGVASVDIAIPPGGHLVPLPEGDRYLGFVIAHADSAAAVEAVLRTAGSLLRVVRAGNGAAPGPQGQERSESTSSATAR